MSDMKVEVNEYTALADEYMAIAEEIEASTSDFFLKLNSVVSNNVVVGKAGANVSEYSKRVLKALRRELADVMKEVSKAINNDVSILGLGGFVKSIEKSDKLSK